MAAGLAALGVEPHLDTDLGHLGIEPGSVGLHGHDHAQLSERVREGCDTVGGDVGSQLHEVPVLQDPGLEGASIGVLERAAKLCRQALEALETVLVTGVEPVVVGLVLELVEELVPETAEFAQQTAEFAQQAAVEQ